MCATRHAHRSLDGAVIMSAIAQPCPVAHNRRVVGCQPCRLPQPAAGLKATKVAVAHIDPAFVATLSCGADLGEPRPERCPRLPHHEELSRAPMSPSHALHEACDAAVTVLELPEPSTLVFCALV